ncbi:hypothetical protein VOLCADRAFT_107440 [Volvox carteri f. nagariensis]|uniref:Uncharacterized protein n=1 Tax=Volvox carteri f. nagariensis TaxID=3068 RepID=D8UE11_VOLCA|nr:uncharacterized protein VOLCADRAFT_107440 [Volvox carteri f. nagariensis]EFJ42009.1 hypothetical protein VOLCADRAFT_107440 [Volvox carteri f. nagariensis]|eukprot:XP_002956884.1 hypothetical protein VOLCADRAFT_107440 [Volvox carteri f. nagariensis]
MLALLISALVPLMLRLATTPRSIGDSESRGGEEGSHDRVAVWHGGRLSSPGNGVGSWCDGGSSGGVGDGEERVNDRAVRVENDGINSEDRVVGYRKGDSRCDGFRRNETISCSGGRSKDDGCGGLHADICGSDASRYEGSSRDSRVRGNSVGGSVRHGDGSRSGGFSSGGGGGGGWNGIGASGGDGGRSGDNDDIIWGLCLTLAAAAALLMVSEFPQHLLPSPFFPLLRKSPQSVNLHPQQQEQRQRELPRELLNQQQASGPQRRWQRRQRKQQRKQQHDQEISEWAKVTAVQIEDEGRAADATVAAGAVAAAGMGLCIRCHDNSRVISHTSSSRAFTAGASATRALSPWHTFPSHHRGFSRCASPAASPTNGSQMPPKQPTVPRHSLLPQQEEGAWRRPGSYGGIVRTCGSSTNRNGSKRPQRGWLPRKSTNSRGNNDKNSGIKTYSNGSSKSSYNSSGLCPAETHPAKKLEGDMQRVKAKDNRTQDKMGDNNMALKRQLWVCSLWKRMHYRLLDAIKHFQCHKNDLPYHDDGGGACPPRNRVCQSPGEIWAGC